MADRNSPYCNFNFIVEIQDADISAGFSEVSGLGSEITVAEYRDGNSPLNNVIKVSGMHKPTDVTLKRGIIDSATLFDWINETQTQGGDAGKRNVTISLMDESNENPVQSWVLTDAIPIKYTGPSLAAKGGTDVAMEELTLSVTVMEARQVA